MAHASSLPAVRSLRVFTRLVVVNWLNSQPVDQPAGGHVTTCSRLRPLANKRATIKGSSLDKCRRAAKASDCY